MEKITFCLALFLLASCSSTRFVDSWKNKEITEFEPQKLLVVGMTDNLTARKIFEEKLQSEFLKRGVNALESSGVIDQEFTDAKRSSEEIEGMTQKLIDQDFDAVVITAVKGVDDRTEYQSGYYTLGYRWVRFGRYWYAYQDVYYQPDYYSNYKVYHVETVIYNLRETEPRSLVWVGSFDIVNPQNISSTIDDYVAKIMGRLERENLIQQQF